MSLHDRALAHPSSVERTLVLLIQAASDLYEQGYGQRRSASRPGLIHILEGIEVLVEQQIGRLDKDTIVDFVNFIYEQIE